MVYQQGLTADKRLGELERYQAMIPQINRLWHVVDFRGSREHPSCGSGLIDEVCIHLERERRLGHRIGTVYLDYALMACRRFCRARSLDEDRWLRRVIGRFVDEALRTVAAHFGCSVWILSQLSGEANKKSSQSVQHYADHAEAKNFAENLDYCFCIGNKDRNNCLKFVAGKTRRSPGQRQPSVLQLTDTSQLISLDGDMAVEATGRIVRRNLHEMAHGSIVTAGSRRAARSGQSGGAAGLDHEVDRRNGR